MENLDTLNELKDIINNSNSIVFFGGAGVSTESGIPDFRSKDGLYNQKYKYPPEEILSHSFFMNNTKAFYEFYRDKLNSLKYEPNVTHNTLSKLESSGKLKAVLLKILMAFIKKQDLKMYMSYMEVSLEIIV